MVFAYVRVCVHAMCRQSCSLVEGVEAFLRQGGSPTDVSITWAVGNAIERIVSLANRLHRWNLINPFATHYIAILSISNKKLLTRQREGMRERGKKKERESVCMRLNGGTAFCDAYYRGRCRNRTKPMFSHALFLASYSCSCSFSPFFF